VTETSGFLACCFVHYGDVRCTQCAQQNSKLLTKTRGKSARICLARSDSSLRHLSLSLSFSITNRIWTLSLPTTWLYAPPERLILACHVKTYSSHPEIHEDIANSSACLHASSQASGARINDSSSCTSAGEHTSEWWSGSVAGYLGSSFSQRVSLLVVNCEAGRVSTEHAALHCIACRRILLVYCLSQQSRHCNDSSSGVISRHQSCWALAPLPTRRLGHCRVEAGPSGKASRPFACGVFDRVPLVFWLVSSQELFEIWRVLGFPTCTSRTPL
jgi:hypothetical protein